MREWEAQFGLVRSVLHKPTPELAQDIALLRDALSALMASRPSRYEQEILPYLEDFSHHWTSSPVTTCGSVEELIAWRRLWPDALFGLELSGMSVRHHEDGRVSYKSVPEDQHISLEALRSLVDSEHMRHVSHLDLGYNYIRGEGVEILASSGNLSSLTSLHLPCVKMTHTGLEALLGSLPRLKTLNLFFNNLGDPAAHMIAASENLADLTHLDLGDNPINCAGLCAIAQSPHMANLTYLSLHAAAIKDEGLLAVAGSSFMSRLEHLKLHSRYYSQEGCRAIVESPHASEALRQQFAEMLEERRRLDELRSQS